MRRYVDRTHAGQIQTVFDPLWTTAPDVPYSRITLANGGATTDVDYDPEGRVTTFVDTTTLPNTTYTLTWIAGNRLVKVERDPTGIGYYVTEFGYDPFGRLIAKKGEDGTVQLFFHDGNNETLRFVASSLSNPATRSFYSAIGELLAIDDFSSGLATTYWALNDAVRTTRDWISQTSDGTNWIIAVDFTATGKTTDTAAFLGAIRYRGQEYAAELQGHYDGRTWTSALIDGRMLSSQSSAIANRYGGKDQTGFDPDASNWWPDAPWGLGWYASLVDSNADRLRGFTSDRFWAHATDGEMAAIYVGAGVAAIIAGVVAAPLVGTGTVTGGVAAGAAAGAVEAGGTYLAVQTVGQYSDFANNRDYVHWSTGDFLTETALGGAAGAVFGAGGYAAASILRPVVTYAASPLAPAFQRFGQSAIVRNVVHYATMDVGPTALAQRMVNSATLKNLGWLRLKVDHFGWRAQQRAWMKGLSGPEAGNYADRYFGKAMYKLNRQLVNAGSEYRAFGQFGRDAFGTPLPPFDRPKGSLFLDGA